MQCKFSLHKNSFTSQNLKILQQLEIKSAVQLTSTYELYCLLLLSNLTYFIGRLDRTNELLF